jgi:hypothetical protein
MVPPGSSDTTDERNTALTVTKNVRTKVQQAQFLLQAELSRKLSYSETLEIVLDSFTTALRAGDVQIEHIGRDS